MVTEDRIARDKARIRALIDAHVRAVQVKDAAGALACVASDIVLFDVVTPLFARGRDVERATL